MYNDLDENTKTESRLKNIREWYEGTINQLREPWTKKVVIGTPKTSSELDIYNIIQDTPSYKVFYMPAIISPPFEEIEYELVKDSEGIVTGVDVKDEEQIETLWPSKWGIKELLFEYVASLDQAIWKREKLLDLRALSGTVFNRSHSNFFDAEKQEQILNDPNTTLYAALDSAWETTESADYSSLLIGAYNNQKLYILDLTREKLSLYSLMDLIVEKYIKWEFEQLVIEKAASGPALLQMLNKETHVPVKPISHGGKNKVQRARVATPYVQQGRVFLFEDAEWRKTFLTEVAGFPFLTHDDTVDSFVYLVMETLLNHRARGGIHV